MKKAVLLANMGAPLSEKEMKIFLKQMFSDKAIIFAPTAVRWFISAVISNLRYKSSWQKYMQIGGTPLQRSMNATTEKLQSVISEEFIVKSVYSYSAPFIENTIEKLYANGIVDFIVISMYPQASYSTTGSLQTSIDKVRTRIPELKIQFIEDYFQNQLFIEFWKNLIITKIKEKSYSNPYLLFSSHAIPKSFIKRGDTYSRKMEISAKLIAKAVNLPYSLGYQSKIGPTEWTKPYTIDELQKLSSNSINEIVVVPLSFINENLETRYDLDTELIPYGINTLNIKDICRVEIPEFDDILVNMFYDFIQK